MTRWMSYGGVTWGDGYAICLDHAAAVTGLDDLPDPRVGNVARGRGDGSVVGPLFRGNRVVTASLVLLEDPSVPTLIAALTDATSSRVELPLRWDFGRGERQVYARCERRSIPTDFGQNRGVARAVLQFVATDPRIYAAPGSGGTHSGSTGPGTRTGGLGFPTGFPLGFGVVTSNTFGTTNNGNTPAPWTAVLNGPLQSPTIELVSSGDRLSWDGLSLAAGQQMTISSRSRTALLDGTATRYPGPRRDWFEIPVGSDDVRLIAESGDGTLVMRWSDTWL